MIALPTPEGTPSTQLANRLRLDGERPAIVSFAPVAPQLPSSAMTRLDFFRVSEESEAPEPTGADRLLRSRGTEIDVEHENEVRSELLSRESTMPLSEEEDVRLRIAMERVDALLPRVTAQDFERLASLIEQDRREDAEVDALLAEFEREKQKKR